ncbi:PDDEXK nuclease domain-containing protein [Dyadobacter psychrophilus]|uniref:Predicted nuclease of restriction endonuclease-like (RecB) superfamily, DUF1016 family n=1 Tax=Dyadobacter psychrophilus TaxID=651661 RepID=A0A1T5FZQ9_9BACT|nr:PDDEXK nuclease domain-containing protein [Dyadobacter psychrophilus]SKC01691.1 Predicted nuclease of restriction endonuclease-like (RecB) superfamily, DUF1016 family [Dyadobacter psychrophilus]
MMNDQLEGQHLFSSVKQLIEQSKRQVAISINATMSMLYWQIGKKINDEILQNKRAEYGKTIVATLSRQLEMEYGNSFSEKNLWRLTQFAEVFTNQDEVLELTRQLSWSHIKELIPINEPLRREFYTHLCIHENWSVRTFRERIKSMLYERTAISKKPEETIINDLNLLKTKQKLNPDLVFRDPYFLDFLGLKDAYSEKDLETSIIVELQKFIIELASDFAFMARQKRITIDNCDYFIDLLFYHRRLRCLVAIDLLCCAQHKSSYVV